MTKVIISGVEVEKFSRLRTKYDGMKIKYNDIVYVVVDNTKQGRKLVLHGFRESGSGTTRFYFAVDKDVNLTAGFTVPEAIGSKQRAEWCK